MEKIETVPKAKWLRRFSGVMVKQDGRNDGIFLMRNSGSAFGKAIDKIQMYPAYLTEDEEVTWKKRPIKIKTQKGYKKVEAYDAISINVRDVPQLIEALHKLTGGTPEVVQKTAEEEKAEAKLRRDMEEFGL